MTEELHALIHALTCPHCNGGGTLAWRLEPSPPHGDGYFSTTPCRTCEGDGLSPQGKEFHAQTQLNAN